jgi:hypothetical protein
MVSPNLGIATGIPGVATSVLNAAPLHCDYHSLSLNSFRLIQDVAITNIDRATSNCGTTSPASRFRQSS